MKPRQPVAEHLRRPGAKSSRGVSLGKDEKSLRDFVTSSRSMRRGFFVAVVRRQETL